MNEYLTTQQLLDELQKRLDYDADVSEQLASESNELQIRINKVIETINKMIYEGYIISNNGTARSYMATGENSEFGMRAKELLDILKGSDSNDNK